MKKQNDIRVDLEKMHPRLVYKLKLLLKHCNENGIYLIITEGFRTKEYQDSLYAKGRTKPGKVVTNAKGITYSSQHMWGIAFDIAINDSKLLYDNATIKKVAKIAKSKKVGLSWGGDWKSIVDTPHFYIGKWGSTTAKLKEKYTTPDNFKKTWTSVTKKPCKLWSKKTLRASKAILSIKKGSKVEVLYKSKLGYAKVKYKGKYGFVFKSVL